MTLRCRHTPDIESCYIDADVGENHDQELYDGFANPALGRPSLLSSQPDKPEPALCQRHEFPDRLRDDVLRYADGGLDLLAGFVGHAQGRALLLRAEGL